MKNTPLTRLLSFGIQVMMALFLAQASMAQDVPVMSLAKAPALKEDLKLSDADYQKFQTIFSNLERIITEMEEKISDMEEQMPGMNPDKITRQKVEKFFFEQIELIENEAKNIRKQLQELLTAEQYEKFSTRVVQVYCGLPQGYIFSDLFDVLKLTDTQKQKLKAQYRQYMINQMQPSGTNTAKEDPARDFENILTQPQRDQLNKRCLELMPSYIKLILVPEELTEYDSLHKDRIIPRAIRLALKQEFLDGIQREAKLTTEETQQVLVAIQKAGKQFQMANYDYAINLRAATDEDESLKTLVRSSAKYYVEFNKELQSFLDQKKRNLLQVRMTQMATNDLIMSCVFLCEEFNATSDNRKNAMTYEFKTIKAYRTYAANVKSKTPDEQREYKQQHDEYESKCIAEFAADLTIPQQTMIRSKILQNRPDYVTQINDAEDAPRE